jgi:hypothetical protein
MYMYVFAGSSSIGADGLWGAAAEAEDDIDLEEIYGKAFLAGTLNMNGCNSLGTCVLCCCSLADVSWWFLITSTAIELHISADHMLPVVEV